MKSAFPDKNIEIGAVILAAGKGHRIGRPKLFLKKDGKTFLELIVSALRQAGIENIVTVVSRQALRDALDLGLPVSIVENPFPEKGMLFSLRLGVEALPNVTGILVCHVDHPFVQIETYQALLENFMLNPEHIVRPLFHGQPGHPILVPRRFAATLPDFDLNGGLRTILHQGHYEVTDVPVEDAAVLQNVNLPEDLPSGCPDSETH